MTGKVDAPDYAAGAKYAYGFADIQANGLHSVGHAGAFPGINAVLDIYPELGHVVTVMSNYDPPAAEQVSEYVGKLLR